MAATTGTPVKLKLGQLHSKLKVLVPEWEVFGIFLDIPRETLKNIESKGMHAGKSMDLKFTEMMESFIKDEGDECTWSTVYSALESMSNNRLAKKIREKYGEGKIEQDVVEVCNALSDCVAEWTTLGIFLGIKKAQIDTIDAKTPYSGLLMDTLDYWLNNTTDRSWEALIKAVRDVNHTKLANELSKEYLENKQ